MKKMQNECKNEKNYLLTQIQKLYQSRIRINKIKLKVLGNRKKSLKKSSFILYFQFFSIHCSRQ